MSGNGHQNKCDFCGKELGSRFFADCPMLDGTRVDLCLDCHAREYEKEEAGGDYDDTPPDGFIIGNAEVQYACACSREPTEKIGVRIRCRACGGFIE